jgi:predicted protein tyrosine phosphatase
MLTSVQFLKVDQMWELVPCENTVVVSVLDNAESKQRPPLEGFHAALALTFEDSFEECAGDPVGSWSDEPTVEEHFAYSWRKTGFERVLTLSEARRLYAFLAEQQAKPEGLELVVHCFGGVSRSAAIALWVSRKWDVPLEDVNEHGTEYANQRVMRLLDKAAALG